MRIEWKTSVKSACVLVSSLVVFGTSAAIAQQLPLFDGAIKSLGVYLPPSSYAALKGQIARDFSAGASAAGFSNEETSRFTAAIERGVTNTGPLVSVGPRVNESELHIARDGNARVKTDYFISFISPERLRFYLEKFSTIKLEVQPAPPRDYKVVVNGEECPATEEGVYKVLPGDSSINVSRPNLPVCQWRGPLTAGQTRVVNCRL